MGVRCPLTLSVVLALTGASAPALADAVTGSAPHPFGKRQHTVRQLTPAGKPVPIPADMQWVSQGWNGENAQMPYLAYMPEKDRLLMLVDCRQPIVTAFITSDDRGKTWSGRKWMSTDARGNPDAAAVGLTYLGGGKLLAHPENVAAGQWRSQDYGRTWKRAAVRDTVAGRYVWDPLLVLKGARGAANKLVEASYRPTGLPRGSPSGHYSQAYLRASEDGGRTWGREARVPQWRGSTR